MIKKMLLAISEYDMLKRDCDVLVGLSGGADSVALLLGLVEIKEKFNLSLRAIHINHNIRGKEAERDEKFCVSLCERLSVPLIVESVDIPSLSKQCGESTELCARNERYRLFKKHSIDFIATAHNAEDNAETVLFNIARGSGTKGACGIPPVRGNIIRPIIYCSREDIFAYLESVKQDFVVDSTNLSNDYTRNKIRHNVIPALKEINSSLFNAFSRFTENIREDMSFLEEEAVRKYNELSFVIDDEIVLRKEVSNLPDALKKRVLILFCESCGISKTKLDYNKLNEFINVLCGKILSMQIYDNFYFCASKKGFVINQKHYNFPFNMDSFDFESHFYKISKKNYENSLKINKLLLKNAIDYDKIIGEMFVRKREDGDKYRPVSRNVTKTLKKLLNESALTPKQKAGLFVVCDDNGIVFTNLFGIDERVKVDSASKNIFVYKNMGGQSNAECY